MDSLNKIVKCYLDILVGILVFVLWCFGYYAGYNKYVCDLSKEVLPTLYITLAQIMGTLSGIIMAGLAIFITMEKSDAMKLLKKSPFYFELFEIYLRCIKILFSGTIISLLALIFNNYDNFRDFAAYMVLGFVIISVINIKKCIWVLKNVIRIQMK